MIVGAGLAGLIAAHIFPGEIHEAAPEPTAMHKALLRFRSQEVSRVTGIDFKAVKVHKGIWSFYADGFVAPSIRLANQYSSKCLDGWLANNRSIWNLAPATRYIAPENFYEQLLGHVGNRVKWRTPFDFNLNTDQVISTAPLDIVLDQLDIKPPEIEFKKAPINVMRFRVENCDLYQTVYYPEPDFPIYRASITKDLLIVELAGASFTPIGTRTDDALRMMNHVYESFGIVEKWIKVLESSDQRYGKIADVDDFARKQLIVRLTNTHNIFSLGRFATWRNILLDDVVADALIVKKLLKANAYERQLHSHT